jgi:hypothetical protein
MVEQSIQHFGLDQSIAELSLAKDPEQTPNFYCVGAQVKHVEANSIPSVAFVVHYM